MTVRACLILAALLALPTTASAQSDGPPMPPAPVPSVACTASKESVCGPGKPLVLRSALAGYTKTLRSDRVRRGLALPSLRRLFGRAGTRAQALAAGRLTGTSRPAGGTRAAGAAALRPVGSVGAVKVQATRQGLGAGTDQISYTDRIYGPRGSQTR